MNICEVACEEPLFIIHDVVVVHRCCGLLCCCVTESQLFSSNADIITHTFLLTLTWWVQCISAFIQDKACYIYASFLSLFVCLLTAVLASRKESWEWMLHSMNSLKLLSQIFKIANIEKGCLEVGTDQKKKETIWFLFTHLSQSRELGCAMCGGIGEGCCTLPLTLRLPFMPHA